MAKIYTDIVSNFNLRKFDVYITNSYEPNVSYYYNRFKGTPIYEPPSGMSFAKYPTSIIVDAIFNEQNITIPSNEDQAIILSIIEEYIETAQAYKSDPKVAFILRKCQKALPMLKKIHTDHTKYLQNKYPNKYKDPNKLSTVLTYVKEKHK